MSKGCDALRGRVPKTVGSSRERLFHYCFNKDYVQITFKMSLTLLIVLLTAAKSLFIVLIRKMEIGHSVFGLLVKNGAVICSLPCTEY